MALFRRQKSEREESLGERLPPGQYLTDKWPVLQAGDPPILNLAAWDFTVDGLVERPLRLSYREFQQLPRQTVHADIHCVTRWSLFDSDWEGVAVQELVERAGVKRETTHVLIHAEHGYTTNLTLADFLRSENMLVDTHDGVPISVEHGFPLRLLVPHLYFWKSAKWVRGFEFLNHDQPGFWEQYGYHNRGDPWKEERYD